MDASSSAWIKVDFCPFKYELMLLRSTSASLQQYSVIIWLKLFVVLFLINSFISALAHAREISEFSWYFEMRL